jgi:hypothetical protein
MQSPIVSLALQTALPFLVVLVLVDMLAVEEEDMVHFQISLAAVVPLVVVLVDIVQEE